MKKQEERPPKPKGGTPKCPLCGQRRIRGCTACFWSQGCCKD